MNSFRIISGAFTPAGNFTGYTALGKRIHIFGRQMKSIGLEKTEEVNFPFFAIAEDKSIQKLDANRQPVLGQNGEPVTEVRLTATAVFENKEEIVNACVEETTLGAEIKISITTAASSLGLSQSVIDSMASAF